MPPLVPAPVLDSPLRMQEVVGEGAGNHRLVKRQGIHPVMLGVVRPLDILPVLVAARDIHPVLGAVRDILLVLGAVQDILLVMLVAVVRDILPVDRDNRPVPVGIHLVGDNHRLAGDNHHLVGDIRLVVDNPLVLGRENCKWLDLMRLPRAQAWPRPLVVLHPRTLMVVVVLDKAVLLGLAALHKAVASLLADQDTALGIHPHLRLHSNSCFYFCEILMSS